MTKPTRGRKTLDVVITDLWLYYSEPEILPPIPVDEGKAGKPSDHSGVLCLPVSNPLKKKVTKKMVRPFPRSSINAFGYCITKEKWDVFHRDMNTNEMV